MSTMPRSVAAIAQRCLPVALCWLAAVVLLAGPRQAVAAQVWGILSMGDTAGPDFSMAPTRLFAYDTLSATLTNYGNIFSYNGVDTLARNFDALAINSAGQLWAFEVFANGTNGRFAIIDPTTIGGPAGVTAVNIGPGPMFTSFGSYVTGAASI